MLPSSIAAAIYSAREWLTPVLKDTQFLEKGVLSPEEFVVAGDYLTRLSPAWRWARGEPAKRRPYLPADKQYLVTSGVPSHHRVRSLQGRASEPDREVTGGAGDGWIEAGERAGGGSSAASGALRSGGGGTAGGGDDDELELIGGAVPISSSSASASSSSAAAAASLSPPPPPPPAAASSSAQSSAAPADDDEYADLSSFMDASLVVHDAAAVSTVSPPADTTPQEG